MTTTQNSMLKLSQYVHSPVIDNLQASNRGKNYDARPPQALELNKSVTYYLAKDMLLHTVEKPGFRHLVAKLDPKYNLPSRKYFSKQEIPSLFAQVRTDIMKKVSEANYYAATTDLWTSSCNQPSIPKLHCLFYK